MSPRYWRSKGCGRATPVQCENVKGAYPHVSARGTKEMNDELEVGEALRCANRRRDGVPQLGARFLVAVHAERKQLNG